MALRCTGGVMVNRGSSGRLLAKGEESDRECDDPWTERLY